jgi:hypothetical protein
VHEIDKTIERSIPKTWSSANYVSSSHEFQVCIPGNNVVFDRYLFLIVHPLDHVLFPVYDHGSLIILVDLAPEATK